MTHRVDPRDVAAANAEVLVRAAKITSIATLVLAFAGTICFSLSGRRNPSQHLGLAVGTFEHLVVEAGALVVLCALASSVGWRHVLVRGRVFARRMALSSTVDREDTNASALSKLIRRSESGASSREIVDRLVRSLSMAPCAPPFDLHLDAGRSVRTLYPFTWRSEKAREAGGGPPIELHVRSFMSNTTPLPEQQRFPQLIDIPTLADRLGVGVRHIRRLATERRVPYLKWGHLIRFDVEQIDAWLRDAEHPVVEVQ